MWNKIVFCVAFLICQFIENGLAVKINKLDVPQVADAHNPTVLDCDYTLDAYDSGLVVKWFFNSMLVYQWIPDHLSALPIGVLKGRVNTSYEADLSPNKRHRALQILNPTSELSGNYTCMVSTYASEDMQSKSMIVLVRPTSLEIEEKLTKNPSSNEFEISCQAKGVSPIPILSLLLGDRELNDTDIEVIPKNNVFDVKVTAIIDLQNNQEEVSCRLNIPKANYISWKKHRIATHAESWCSTLQIPAFWPLTFLVCLNFFVFSVRN